MQNKVFSVFCKWSIYCSFIFYEVFYAQYIIVWKHRVFLFCLLVRSFFPLLDFMNTTHLR